MKYKLTMKHYRPGCLQYQTLGSVESGGFWQATKRSGQQAPLSVRLRADSLVVDSKKDHL